MQPKNPKSATVMRLLVAIALALCASDAALAQKDLLSCSKCNRNQARCNCKYCGYCAQSGHDSSNCRVRLREEREREERRREDERERERNQREFEQKRERNRREFEQNQRKQQQEFEERQSKWKQEMEENARQWKQKREERQLQQRLGNAAAHAFSDPSAVHGGVEPLELAYDNFGDFYDDPVRKALAAPIERAGDGVTEVFRYGFKSAAVPPRSGSSSPRVRPSPDQAWYPPPGHVAPALDPRVPQMLDTGSMNSNPQRVDTTKPRGSALHGTPEAKHPSRVEHGISVTPGRHSGSPYEGVKSGSSGVVDSRDFGMAVKDLQRSLDAEHGINVAPGRHSGSPYEGVKSGSSGLVDSRDFGMVVKDLQLALDTRLTNMAGAVQHSDGSPRWAGSSVEPHVQVPACIAFRGPSGALDRVASAAYVHDVGLNLDGVSAWGGSPQSQGWHQHLISVLDDPAAQSDVSASVVLRGIQLVKGIGSVVAIVPSVRDTVLDPTPPSSQPASSITFGELDALLMPSGHSPAPRSMQGRFRELDSVLKPR
jgi:hypothetical protein